MGILTKRTAFALEKTPRDTILLLHGLRLMSDYRNVGERAVFYAFLKTLPEFKTEDLDDLDKEVATLRAEYPSSKDAVAALAGISSDVVKKKTFLLAVDIAMSSGHVDAIEDELLEEMRTVLGLDLATAEGIVEFLSLKYAT